MGIPSNIDSLKSRRYSSSCTPAPIQNDFAHGPSQPQISQVNDISSLPLSILNMNLMSPSSMVPKSARSISVSDPLCSVELNSLSSQAAPYSCPLTPHGLGVNRYKTEMCRSFIENGHCKYATKCQFAHGEDEMRHVPRHPKYKTELCRTFHNTGYCSYGSRCHFIHSEDKSKLVEQKKAAAAQQVNQQMRLKIAELQMHKTTIESVLAQLVANQLNAQLSPPLPIVNNIPRPQLLGSTGEFTPSSGSDSPVVLSPTLSFDVDNDQADNMAFSNMEDQNRFVFPNTSLESSPVHLCLNQDDAWSSTQTVVNLMKALTVTAGTPSISTSAAQSIRLRGFNYLNRE